MPMLCIYCTTSVRYQLPRRGWGSCPVSLPAGRGQSGAQSEAGHSRPAPVLNATATQHWRTLSGLGGAWITHKHTHMHNNDDINFKYHKHAYMGPNIYI